MGSTWRKAKAALGLKLCVYLPRTSEDDEDEESSRRLSDVASATSATTSDLGCRALTPMTPTPTSSGLRMPKSGSRSSKKTCAICLAVMKVGDGHAIFSAECSHTFHFQCIASSVKHGNRVCPICRAKWKETPFQGPPTSSEFPHGRARVSPINWSQDETYVNLLRRVPRNDSSNRQHHHASNLFHTTEPATFDDDEPVDFHVQTLRNSQQVRCMKTLEIKTYPEFSAIPKSASEENFTILIHLKAPQADTRIVVPGRTLHTNNSTVSQTSRAPIDLVTVLDISGSMSGTKLALLKRAMGFVIQNLGPSDRLSVIAFSSTARRLFKLRKMTSSGRQHALQAVNALVSNGGTNIAEGLKKGAKVIEERKEKNPVCSIILLSDGQDTYTILSGGNSDRGSAKPDYHSLVPCSVHGRQIPVHAFGFGADHDSGTMHAVSESSGGTFSFIEAEGAIQDAFAQCIGGLLSVVVQGLRVSIECVHSGVHLATIKSGSYGSRVADDRRHGYIDVGDLYADEERDFLISVNVPAVSVDSLALLTVSCVYKDPVTTKLVCIKSEEGRIERPETVTLRTMSMEVDRERNRVGAAEAMADARAAAEQGLLSEAVSILEARRKKLSETLAGRSGDRLCVALDAEMREMQERMASRQKYEASGRAYVLSGLSSHSWQRATARGDSTSSETLVHAYQTPGMVSMLNLSQVFSPLSQSSTPIRPTRSFSSHPLEPR